MDMTKQEQRLMEAFTQYESGVSLATLQTVFSDVAVELNQMVEAERMMRTGKEQMKPSQELGRKIFAALREQQQKNEASIFMSALWRFAAPVGIAALSLMFMISHQHAPRFTPTTDGGADLFAIQEAAPMMAKNAAVSLMAVAPEQDAEVMSETSADARMASDTNSDSLYRWQLIALGLLTLLSLVVLYKHWLVRRRSFV